MTSLAHLERLARSATPGSWRWDEADGYIRPAQPHANDPIAMGEPTHEGNHRVSIDPDDAAYIAAASPDVILQLLADRRELVATVRELLIACPPLDVDRGDNGHDDQLSCEAWDAIAKLQALAASMGET